MDPDKDPLTYTWDLNGDGLFADAGGATLTWAQLQALGIGDDGVFNARVRVTDGYDPP